MANNKILIIEDDAIVAGIYRNRLKLIGFSAEVASDGQQGIEKVTNFRPDLVLLDLMLPKVNGVEVIKFIRSQPQLQNLPIIVFSNSYLSTMVQDAWKAGANTCLSKVNCTPTQVLDVIRNTLGVSGSAGGTTVNPHPAISTQEQELHIDHVESQPTAQLPTQSVLSNSQEETQFLDDVRKTFLDSAPALLTNLREVMMAFLKAPESDNSRLHQLFELYRRVHSVTSNAGVAGLGQVSEMTIALEVLLKELYENPKNISPSTMRTVAQSIDILGLLFKFAKKLERQKSQMIRILVVDDEVISRRAITFALEKAHLKSLTSDNPEAALQLLNDNHFDLIVLDADMPKMNGFQLCAKIRTLPGYSQTPVIFVTGLTEFESRAKSDLSGGSDLIAKPFLFMELAVKALTHVLRSHLDTLR